MNDLYVCLYGVHGGVWLANRCRLLLGAFEDELEIRLGVM